MAGGKTEERRANPRHAVDCAVSIRLIHGAVPMEGRVTSLSLDGCLVTTSNRFPPEIRTRVEVEFQLRGHVFRFVGVSEGSRGAGKFAIRFLEVPLRRRGQLAETLLEIAGLEASELARIASS